MTLSPGGPVSKRRTRARRARAVLAGVLLLPGATGCYTYVPLWNGTPAPGSEISLGLSDRGRVALSGPLGPGARQVTGRLANSTDSAYVIRVSEVAYIGGGPSAKWSGEEITVAKEYVSGMAERQLSKSRSWLAAGIAVGVAALATTIAIKGYGSDASNGRVGDGGGQTQ